MDAEKLGYRIAEVSKMIQCSPKHIQILIREGRLKAVNTGKGPDHPRWLILRADLMAFLEPHVSTGETTNE